MGDPLLRSHVWRPVLQSLAIFLALGVGLSLFVVPRLASLMATFLDRTSANVIGALLYALAALTFSALLFLPIAGFVGSQSWGQLSREIEIRDRGSAIDGSPSLAARASDTILRLGFNLFMLCLALCSSYFIPIFGPIVIVGLVAMLDVTSSAYARRGITFPGQIRWVLSAPGVISFWLGCGVLGIIPVLNVLSLPAMVAGGTLMVGRQDQADRPTTRRVE